MVEDAAHDRSVTRRLLMGALHRLEYEATFGARSSTEDIARQMTLLDGQWALVRGHRSKIRHESIFGT